MKRTILKFLSLGGVIGVACFCTTVLAFANNVTISNVALTNQDKANYTAKVEFDITWSNSWRTTTNYDAVWVFVKYSTDSGVTWNHLQLNASGTTPTGFSGGSAGLEIVVPTDKTGAFLQRATAGSGTVTSTDVQLVWNWGAAGLTSGTQARVKVFAIEMVYVPAGAFYLGDNTNRVSQTNSHFWQANDVSDPRAAALVSSGTTIISNRNDGLGTAGHITWVTETMWSGTLPASAATLNSFPNGYNAFYVMKYELAQGQYRDFLNTLTRTQQNSRVATQAASLFTLSANPTLLYRCGLRNPTVIPAGPITFGCDLDTDTTFDESNDGEWIACNYLGWQDLTAYADWAGLRPMTELEYEKACRGPLTPVSFEYAWGTTACTTAGIALSSSGQNSEGFTTSGSGFANINVASPLGPYRCGFAATALTTREGAAAAYYGAMELTGNLFDLVVSVGDASGRAYAGTQGDGTLSSSGFSDVVDWPGYTYGNSNYTYIMGIGNRGGYSGSDTSQASSPGRVSSRYLANNTGGGQRALTLGGRLVRTAP